MSPSARRNSPMAMRTTASLTAVSGPDGVQQGVFGHQAVGMGHQVVQHVKGFGRQRHHGLRSTPQTGVVGIETKVGKAPVEGGHRSTPLMLPYGARDHTAQHTTVTRRRHDPGVCSLRLSCHALWLSALDGERRVGAPSRPTPTRRCGTCRGLWHDTHLQTAREMPILRWQRVYNPVAIGKEDPCPPCSFLAMCSCIMKTTIVLIRGHQQTPSSSIVVARGGRSLNEETTDEQDDLRMVPRNRPAPGEFGGAPTRFSSPP